MFIGIEDRLTCVNHPRSPVVVSNALLKRMVAEQILQNAWGLSLCFTYSKYSVVKSTIGAQEPEQKHLVYCMAPTTVGLPDGQFPTRGAGLRRSHKKESLARYRPDSDRRSHSTRQCQIAPSPKIKVQLFRAQPRV
ncbi:hypothetical protein P875_00010976 [Aspergillus parasiticus SU-1]|uniref:Uncharacterized protein n=1 Tax=Aspergillus parasiticus (strain ATCC 56775 / NRRL 5862 / SRRC 143 / SU-1) TaxID=1403190 RepID=A0A0F0ICB4_ASPPU|nr:hypothetical protein P875_00010976 [Aspergillus parasiticus SU-1]